MRSWPPSRRAFRARGARLIAGAILAAGAFGCATDTAVAPKAPAEPRASEPAPPPAALPIPPESGAAVTPGAPPGFGAEVQPDAPSEFDFLVGREHELAGRLDEALAAYKQFHEEDPNSHLYIHALPAIEIVEHSRNIKSPATLEPTGLPLLRMIELHEVRSAMNLGWFRKRFRCFTVMTR